MRPKKGKSPEERLKELVDSVVGIEEQENIVIEMLNISYFQLFDKVREQHSLDWVISKVELIAGDVMEPQLGISPEDIEILRNEVSIVVHCAATVRQVFPLPTPTLKNSCFFLILINTDLMRPCAKPSF